MDLKTLANEIEDVLDPASMDKVLMYYKDVQEEDEEFMQVCTFFNSHRKVRKL